MVLRPGDDMVDTRDRRRGAAAWLSPDTPAGDAAASLACSAAGGPFAFGPSSGLGSPSPAAALCSRGTMNRPDGTRAALTEL